MKIKKKNLRGGLGGVGRGRVEVGGRGGRGGPIKGWGGGGGVARFGVGG